jgi:hypothetical protein
MDGGGEVNWNGISAGLALVAAFLAPSPAGGQERLVTGKVYSCMMDGIRTYTTKPVAGCPERREISYSYIERLLNPGERAIYSCRGADGVQRYTGAAGPGCHFVASYFENSRTVTRPLASYTPLRFHGYRCTRDCSGHQAGYEWAEDNGITDMDDCEGNSQSFIEGCQAYAEEQG